MPEMTNAGLKQNVLRNQSKSYFKKRGDQEFRNNKKRKLSKDINVMGKKNETLETHDYEVQQKIKENKINGKEVKKIKVKKMETKKTIGKKEANDDLISEHFAI